MSWFSNHVLYPKLDQAMQKFSIPFQIGIQWKHPKYRALDVLPIVPSPLLYCLLGSSHGLFKSWFEISTNDLSGKRCSVESREKSLSTMKIQHTHTLLKHYFLIFAHWLSCGFDFSLDCLVSDEPLVFKSVARSFQVFNLI